MESDPLSRGKYVTLFTLFTLNSIKLGIEGAILFTNLVITLPWIFLCFSWGIMMATILMFILFISVGMFRMGSIISLLLYLTFMVDQFCNIILILIKVFVANHGDDFSDIISLLFCSSTAYNVLSFCLLALVVRPLLSSSHPILQRLQVGRYRNLFTEHPTAIVENQCSICLSDYQPADEISYLTCNHHFHQTCLTPWLERDNTCPTCRQIVEV